MQPSLEDPLAIADSTLLHGSPSLSGLLSGTGPVLSSLVNEDFLEPLNSLAQSCPVALVPPIQASLALQSPDSQLALPSCALGMLEPVPLDEGRCSLSFSSPALGTQKSSGFTETNLQPVCCLDMVSHLALACLQLDGLVRLPVGLISLLLGIYFPLLDL